jgi:lipoprotein-releasing system ATP-binding protein
MKIELSNIHKSYFLAVAEVEQAVLKGVSFHIEQGESLAIIGPSGSGKTTLLNLLGTLDTADQGQLTFDGQSIDAYSPKKLALFRNQEIGFVFQTHHLLPQLNVLENVMLPTLAFGNKKARNQSENLALKWLDKVGLSDKIDKLPAQLSGGECQRVAVVRALINQPKLILADEPTGSLDQESADQLSKLLLQISQEEKVSLVVVTHSEKLANKMQKVLELKDGRIVERK